MNDKKLKSFLVSGWILTALLIIEDLFLIYCAVLNIFFYEPHINRMLTGILVFTPFIITFIYSLLSFFEKSKDRSKTLILGIIVLIISFGGIWVFFPILIYISAFIAFAGIILAIHGLIKSKITFTYGIICINIVYFAFLMGEYIIIFANVGYAPSGLHISEITLAAALITIICTFIIADLACTAKRQNVKAALENQNET